MATINLFQKLAHPGGTDKLRTALSELVASNSVAQQENTLYKKKLEEANAYVERLEDGYRQLLQRNAQLRTVVAADRSSISRLGTIIKQNTAQLLSLKEEMASATEDLQAAKANHDNLLEQQDKAKSCIESLSASLCHKSSELQTALENLQEAIAKAANLEQELELANKEAANAKAVAEEQIRQLQDRLKQSSDRLDEAHETVQRLQMETSESVKAHEKEIERLHAQANDAAEKAKSLHEQLDTAHEEVQRLQSQIQDAKQALDIKEKELQASHASNISVRDELDQATRDLANTLITVEQLQTQITELQVRAAKLEADHAAEMKSVREAHALDLKSKSDELSENQTQLAKLREQLDAAIESEKQLRENSTMHVEQLQQKVADQDATLHEAEKHTKDVTHRLATTEQTLSEALAAIKASKEQQSELEKQLQVEQQATKEARAATQHAEEESLRWRERLDEVMEEMNKLKADMEEQNQRISSAQKALLNGVTATQARITPPSAVRKPNSKRNNLEVRFAEEASGVRTRRQQRVMYCKDEGDEENDPELIIGEGERDPYCNKADDIVTDDEDGDDLAADDDAQGGVRYEATAYENTAEYIAAYSTGGSLPSPDEEASDEEASDEVHINERSFSRRRFAAAKPPHINQEPVHTRVTGPMRHRGGVLSGMKRQLPHLQGGSSTRPLSLAATQQPLRKRTRAATGGGGGKVLGGLFNTISPDSHGLRSGAPSYGYTTSGN